MRKISLVPLALAIALSAASAAVAAPAYFPISRCSVVNAVSGEPLLPGTPQRLAIDAASCGVPASADAVLVELAAVEPGAAGIVAVPEGRNLAEPTVLAAGGPEQRATIRVPIDRDLRGQLAVEAATTAGGSPTQIAVDVVGYFEEAATFTGTTGFIRTRPTCVPPKYTPDALNYLQGPEPIQLPNGDVTLLVGAGRCCLGGRHWEGIFSLNYPAAGRLATPRFRGLWATNDFGKQSQRKEAELGFPSALFYGGKWRVGFTTTFLPFHKPNTDRASRIDLADLITRAAPSQVTNAWVKPVNPACAAVGSCQGRGSGIDPVLTLHPNGDLFLYHKDGNYPACPSGFVRHRVAANLTVVNSAVDGCVRFEGLAQAPFLISDIARTQDGRMLLLVEKADGLGYIAEWVSEGGPAEIGLLWRQTGRVWPAPAHPNGAPWGYYVRDAAFLKDASRTVVEPNVVVGQISDGRTYAEMVDVQLGRWFLYYWADEGAVLPPSFGGPASSCALQGKHEASNCTEIRGWAWDPMFPTSPINVEVLVDGVYAATVPADVLRPDLVGTRGDGRHSFVWPIPAALRDGRSHKVTVRFAESTDLLAGKPKPIKCN
jgi:hypothetical protein